MSDVLNLSDAEFEKLPVEVQESEPESTTEIPPEAPETASEEVSEVEVGEDTPEENKSSEEPDNGLQEQEQETSEEVKQPEPEVDYKSTYEEIFKPFKANGKEMKVESIEDVRQLMQMGANYNKKMAALKPNLKLVKMLENNQLLDEEKLSFLIDVTKGDKNAIKKLIKDSGIDPLEVDINEEVSYKPNTYTVNDKELELEAVLSEIRETDTFNTTIDIVGNKWDDSSKKVLIDNPGIIKVINSHVESGIYNTITTEVERLRMLGKLDGLSDIEAYKAVGDSMYAPGANAHRPVSTNINTSTSKATNKEDPRLAEKRKAASTTKSVASNKKPDFNPLAMSDEEFEKIASSKFI